MCRENLTYKNLQRERVQKLKDEERADTSNNQKNLEFQGQLCGRDTSVRIVSPLRRRAGYNS